MPNLPTEALPAAEFILRHLYRPIEAMDGVRFFAVTETERLTGGDDWFWLDDNAKVLEFLSRPEVWRRFPDQVVEILRFVRWLCRPPFMFRRISAPRLQHSDEESKDGTTHHVHSLMHIRHDLRHGCVVAGVRFHDGRTADNLLLGGNSVIFTHGGRRYAIGVEDAIAAVEATETDRTLTLRHSSELFFKPRLRSRRLGRISYLYTIDACSMLIGVEAVLEIDPAANVSDVELTIGHDRLSHRSNAVGVAYHSVSAVSPSGSPIFAADLPGVHEMAAEGASYYSIAQAEIAGFALAVHTTPRCPERLAGFEIDVKERGRLDRVRARYRFPGPAAGRLAIGEDKLLTAGGFYRRGADYAALLRAAIAEKPRQRAAFDYSISYDYGAEINAFAKCYAVCAAERPVPNSALDPDELRALCDCYLDAYFDLFVTGHYEGRNTIMSRQLAFVILAVVTLYGATGDERYRRQLKRLCDVLLDFEVRYRGIADRPAAAFPYGMSSERQAFVDGHSASLLALTQAADCIADARFAAAIERGLESYCIETTAVHLGRPVKIDTVSTLIGDAAGRLHAETSYWNFNAGLALRFFSALRRSRDPDLQRIAGRCRQHIELLELVLRWQLQRSITEREGCIEIRTGIYSGETNSETQPWVMLGLLGHPYDLGRP
ncbi:MAG TPA: hypothetical protein VJR70_11150 [Stellaceae bacterium]|nr:hypothetical protein [Stellaceae bacterium]